MTSVERHEIRYHRRKAKRLEKKLKQCGNCDDFLKVFTFENLLSASKKCFRGVRWKSSVQKFAANRILYVAQIRQELLEGKLKIENTYEFYLYERGKKRHIRSIGIKERVVQRCLCDYSLVPMLQRTFIYDNGASMAGKGVSFTRKRLKKHLLDLIKENPDTELYVLVFDFKKYFESIPHDLIINILKKNYTDERLINLIMQFVTFSNTDKGIDLGSQISQILALAAANSLDHFIKETLGYKKYARYMDDGYILSNEKEWLKVVAQLIDSFVSNMGMTLNSKKTRIVKLSKGFVFLKNRYRVINNSLVITPTNSSTIRMRRKLKKFRKKLNRNEMDFNDIVYSFVSWKGHLKGSKHYHVVQNMNKLFDTLFIDDFAHHYVRYLPDFKEGMICISK